MPAKRAARLVLLDQVAQAFEPGRRYPEQTVNEILKAVYDDHAALRRYLIDEGLLSRTPGGTYWRSGGTVPIGQPARGTRKARGPGRPAAQGNLVGRFARAEQAAQRVQAVLGVVRGRPLVEGAVRRQVVAAGRAGDGSLDQVAEGLDRPGPG